MPPPLYTPLPPPTPAITNPSDPKVRLAAPNLATQKLIFERTKKFYQIPIALIQRSSLPSYDSSTQTSASSPPSESKTATRTANPETGLETSSKPPAYSRLENGSENSTPTTTESTTPSLYQLTTQTTTTHLTLPLGSSTGYLAPLDHKTLLKHIQALLESQRVIPLTRNLICQCEIHLWTSAPASTPLDRLLSRKPLHHVYKPIEHVEYFVEREMPHHQNPIRQDEAKGTPRQPIATDISTRIRRKTWDHENRGRRMLERVIGEGGVCGFEVYWWVRDSSDSGSSLSGV